MSSEKSNFQQGFTPDAAFEGPVKASDLDFYNLLRRQAGESRLFFNGQRAVIFDVDAIGTLRQQLIESLGPTVAAGVLARFGYTQGQRDAEMLEQRFDWETDTDWLTAGLNLNMLEGMVHVQPEFIEFDRETGHFHMRGVWLNSYEAEAHLKRFGLSPQPVCWSLTGYTSGYATRFFGQELLAVETECVGKGDARCYWEIRPVEAWGEEAHSYRQALQTIETASQPDPSEVALQNVPPEEYSFEQKQVEGTMWQSQTLLQDILDTLPLPVYVLDSQGRFLLINQVFADLFNLDKKAVIGKTDFDIFAEDTAEEFQSNDLEILKAGLPVQVEEQLEFADGLHTYFTHKYPLRDTEGIPYALVGISTDITERKKFEQALAKRAAELEAITQVSAAAASILKMDKLLQEVVDLTKRRFGLYHAHIYLLDTTSAEDKGSLTLAAGAGEIGRQMVAQGWAIPLEREQSLVAQAARSRQAVVVNDVRLNPDFLPNLLLPNTRSEMAVPLIVGTKVLGVLDVQSEVIDRFTEEDVRIKTILAQQIAVALENARLFEQTQARARREQLLREVTDRVRSSVDADTIMRIAAQEVGKALGRPAFVYLGQNNQNPLPQANEEANYG